VEKKSSSTINEAEDLQRTVCVNRAVLASSPWCAGHVVTGSEACMCVCVCVCVRERERQGRNKYQSIPLEPQL